MRCRIWHSPRFWKLAALLAVVVGMMLPIAVLALKHVAVWKIEQSGGWVYYDESNDMPAWLVRTFGNDLCRRFQPVAEIHFGEGPDVRGALWWSRQLVATANEVSLWCCQHGDESLSLFPAKNRIKILSLHGCDVTDASIHRLAQFQSLQELFITNTEISTSGVKALQAALPSCKIYSGNWVENPDGSHSLKSLSEDG